MKTKIINIDKGYWNLVTDEASLLKDGRPLVLMTISSYNDNGHYSITDFRYQAMNNTLFKNEPSIYPIAPEMRIFHRTENTEKHFHSLFNFPVQKDHNFYTWFSNSGYVLENADRPFELQTQILKDEMYVWSYKAAKQKMKEAKEFWLSFDPATQEWTESKITNNYLRPSEYEMTDKLKRIIG